MKSSHHRGMAAFVALCLALGSLLFAAGPASAYPPGTAATLAVNPSTVAQGGTTQVTGAHFTPNSTVSLDLHSRKVNVGSGIPTDAAGSFTTTITVPADFPTGDHEVTGTDAQGETASAALAVTASSSTGPTASDTTPTEGGSITISGVNCTPGATVTATLDTGDVIGSATAGADGSYTIAGTLPSGVTGQHTITVSGGGSGQGCSGVLGVDIQASSGPPFNTGVAVMSIGGIGVLLLVAGGLFLMVGRRRGATPAA